MKKKKKSKEQQLKLLRVSQKILAGVLAAGACVTGGLSILMAKQNEQPEQMAEAVPETEEAVEETIPEAEPEVESESETETESETVPEEEDQFIPQFSAEPGFYQDHVMLSLSSPEGVMIYYTTDGSTPTEESSIYTGPILISSREGEENYIASRSDTSPEGISIDEPVDKATVVRAIAKNADGEFSKIATHTYFVDLDESYYKGTRIVSISTDEDNLFDYHTGIYCRGWVYDNLSSYRTKYFIPANYTQTGREWEREVGVEIFDTDGTSIASQEMGMRIMGGTSRNSIQKTLKLYAREEYGDKKLKADLFPDLMKEYHPEDDIKKFKTIVLRNGGDDHYGTKFRDAFIQRLFEDRNISTQHAEPALGFLNGEFLGVYNLQEDYSDEYIESHYGVPKDDVIMVKIEEIEEGTDEDYEDYRKFSSFVNNADLSDPDVYAEFCEKMDIESLIDYFSLGIWTENNDWINKGNNYRLWRSRTITDQPYQDGKWRWAAYDTEYSMGCDRGGEPRGSSRILNNLKDKQGYQGTNFFMQPLLQNEEFKAQFVTTFMDICNSCFEPKHALAVLEDMYENEYGPLLNKGFRRTGPLSRIGSDEEMTAYTEKILGYEKKFIEGRTEECIHMLTDCLDLSGETEEVTIMVNNTSLGAVQIGTVNPDWETSTWKGTYFTDYPITLTAIPNEGSTFTGWTGKGISKADEKKLTITVPVSKALRITANFS